MPALAQPVVTEAKWPAFKVRPEDTQGRLLYTLGDGQWNIPKLRVLLEQIIPEHDVMEDYEVEHNFPVIGHRTMYLNARRVMQCNTLPTKLQRELFDSSSSMGEVETNELKDRSARFLHKHKDDLHTAEPPAL